jgi:hypothetical protein
MYAMEALGTGIYALDLANGNSTLVSNYNPAVIGHIYAAAVPSQPTTVPEPSGLALFGMSVTALLGLGIIKTPSCAQSEIGLLCKIRSIIRYCRHTRRRPGVRWTHT